MVSPIPAELVFAKRVIGRLRTMPIGTPRGR